VEASLICLDDCSDGAGKYSVSLGMCECDDLKLLEDVCDDACQSTSDKLTYSDKGVCVTGGACLAIDGINAVKVSVNCPSGDCQVVSLTVSDGVGGSFGTPAGLSDLQTVHILLLRYNFTIIATTTTTATTTSTPTLLRHVAITITVTYAGAISLVGPCQVPLRHPIEGP
jgi:hypothetical protein